MRRIHIRCHPLAEGYGSPVSLAWGVLASDYSLPVTHRTCSPNRSRWDAIVCHVGGGYTNRVPHPSTSPGQPGYRPPVSSRPTR